MTSFDLFYLSKVKRPATRRHDKHMQCCRGTQVTAEGRASCLHQHAIAGRKEWDFGLWGIESLPWWPDPGLKHLYPDIVLSITTWEISCLFCEIVIKPWVIWHYFLPDLSSLKMSRLRLVKMEIDLLSILLELIFQVYFFWDMLEDRTAFKLWKFLLIKWLKEIWNENALG